MMTQSVMTQTANLSRTTAGTSTSRAKPNNSGFEIFMDRNMMNSDSTDTQTKSKAVQTRDNLKDTGVAKSNKAYGEGERNKIDEESADSEQDKTVKKEEASQKAPTESDQLKATSEKATGSQASEGTQENTAEDGALNPGNDELEAQLLSLLQSIQQAVAELLQLKPEELTAMLKEQGLDLSDLANPEYLQKLVMANNGSTDIMDFLTDGNLKAEFDQLLKQVETILKDAGPELTPDQLKSALEKLMERVEQEKYLQTDEVEKTGVQEQHKSVRDELSAVSDRNEAAVNVSHRPEAELLKESGNETGGKQTASDQERSEVFDREAASRYETFVDNLTKTVQEVDAEPMMDSRMIELKEIAGQILERVRVVMKPDQTSMEMVLNPEHLGKVNLTVVSKDGSMTAMFKVENELAREAIESQLQTLKDTLNSQGIKVEAIEVTVTGYSFGQSRSSGEEEQGTGQSKNQGHKITLEEALQSGEQPEVEGVTADVTGLRGSNIDMTA